MAEVTGLSRQEPGDPTWGVLPGLPCLCPAHVQHPLPGRQFSWRCQQGDRPSTLGDRLGAVPVIELLHLKPLC